MTGWAQNRDPAASSRQRRGRIPFQRAPFCLGSEAQPAELRENPTTSKTRVNSRLKKQGEEILVKHRFPQSCPFPMPEITNCLISVAATSLGGITLFMSNAIHVFSTSLLAI